MCYSGYEKCDNIITTLSGIFGILIVLFPCRCPIAEDVVGIFQLPLKVSNIIHCISAISFFALLAYNSLFLFTKHGEVVTDKKKKRNTIYIICGSIMCVCPILLIIPVYFTAKIWWVEAVSLVAFSISWLTKGEAFPFLNDK